MQYTVKQTFYFQGKLWVAGSTIDVNAHLVDELMELGLLGDAEKPTPPVAKPSFATRISKPKKSAA